MLNFQLDLLLICCLRLFLVIHNSGKNPVKLRPSSGERKSTFCCLSSNFAYPPLP
ncbi:hypothetical protein Hanom_Chr09g00864561 [Helianthus anomalus]